MLCTFETPVGPGRDGISWPFSTQFPYVVFYGDASLGCPFQTMGGFRGFGIKFPSHGSDNASPVPDRSEP